MPSLKDSKQADETMRRIAVKIGSNVLTRADGTLDITRMSAIADQVADLHKRGMQVILVSSGAVASGRSEIKLGHMLDEVSSRQLYSAIGQAKLMGKYYTLFTTQAQRYLEHTSEEEFAERRKKRK